jgi:hypothetical protein
MDLAFPAAFTAFTPPAKLVCREIVRRSDEKKPPWNGDDPIREALQSSSNRAAYGRARSVFFG